MIVVPVKEGENIEKALKKFKRKFEKTGVVKELRARQQFRQAVCIEQTEKRTCYLCSETSASRRIIKNSHIL